MNNKEMIKYHSDICQLEIFRSNISSFLNLLHKIKHKQLSKPVEFKTDVKQIRMFLYHNIDQMNLILDTLI